MINRPYVFIGAIAIFCVFKYGLRYCHLVVGDTVSGFATCIITGTIVVVYEKVKQKK